MITYFIKSAICLALLLAFYHLVLEREKMHKFNRFYLLGSVLFSFLAPLYIIYIEAAPVAILETATATPTFYVDEFTPTEIAVEKTIDYTSILLGIYILICGIFAFRFARNLFKIIAKIRKNEYQKLEHATLVLVDDKILPHSFWNYIFINKEEHLQNKLAPELITHELTHVTQKHTIDILLLEILMIAFWINPLFIFLKKAIQLNHEFLADHKVIKTYKNIFQYQHLLLSKAAWKNEYYLASNLNYSLTKKRLKMMTAQNSKKTVLLKKLAVIPVLIAFIFLFAERVEAQKTIDNTPELTEEVKELLKNTPKITLPNGEKTKVIEDPKKEYIDSPIPSIPSFVKEFTFIEGEPFMTTSIKPKKTKKGTITDIRLKLKDVDALKITYSNREDVPSFIKEARKNIQNDTIPKKTSATETQMKQYKTLMAAGKKHNIYKVKDIVKMKNIYNSMSKSQKKSVENVFDMVPPPPPKPDWVFTYQRLANRIQRTAKNRKANVIYLKEIYNNKMNADERKKVDAPEKVLPPPPPSKIDTIPFSYNLLAKKIKSNPKINKTDANRLKSLYNGMSEVQKSKVEAPNEILPPPPPTIPKVPEIKNLDDFKKKYPINDNENDPTFYLDGKKISKSDFSNLKPNDIQSLNVIRNENERSVYITSKTKAQKETSQYKKSKIVPSNFALKLNDSTTASFSTLESIKEKKEGLSKVSEDDKKQLSYRNMIIYIVKLKQDKFNYKIEGKTVTLSQIESFINNNPQSSIQTKENLDGSLTLSFSNSDEKKMNYNQLQNVYTNVFEKTK